LKANYPAEYMAALLTSVADDKDKMAVYLAECRQMGIKILSPDVNESVVDFTAVGSDVRFGLKAVRNVGVPVIESLVRTRQEKGKYTSFADFLDKVELVVCNKRTVDSLIKAGAFDSLGHTRLSLNAVHENAIDAVTGVKKQQAIGQDDLFGALDTGTGTPAIGLDFDLPDREWPRKQLLSLEREMLGLYVSSHPLDGAEHVLSKNRDVSIAELLGSGRTEGEVRLSGLVTAVDRRINKAGNAWAIITLADRDGSVEVLFFPAAYQLMSAQMVEDNVISIRGRLNERDGALSVFGQEITTLDISSAELGTKPPVQITVPVGKITPELVAELKRALQAHPGDVPVRLLTTNWDKNTLYELGYRVNAENGLASDIKTLLGTHAWMGTV
ncbi:OB-fold nucleic acid binding domain-containing protein, partial [Kitasatospora sp. NPDC007106]|uniref:helix-hairpin-helix domain-containing protein n=1 Tax=Kitasatospora sp. NPDC007106 TaxID=3156914 RepID=UPI0033DEDE70